MTETWLSITAHLSPTCSLQVVLWFSLNNTGWREDTLWCPNEFYKSGITLPMAKKNILAEVYWTSWIDKYSFEKLDRLKGRQFMVIRFFQKGPKDHDLLPRNFIYFQCTTFTRRHDKYIVNVWTRLGPKGEKSYLLSVGQKDRLITKKTWANSSQYNRTDPSLGVLECKYT